MNPPLIMDSTKNLSINYNGTTTVVVLTVGEYVNGAAMALSIQTSINTTLGLVTTQNKWSVVYNAVTGKYAFSTLLIPFSLLLDPGNSSPTLANLLGFPPIDTTGTTFAESTFGRLYATSLTTINNAAIVPNNRYLVRDDEASSGLMVIQAVARLAYYNVVFPATSPNYALVPLPDGTTYVQFGLRHIMPLPQKLGIFARNGSDFDYEWTSNRANNSVFPSSFLTLYQPINQEARLFIALSGVTTTDTDAELLTTTGATIKYIASLVYQDSSRRYILDESYNFQFSGSSSIPSATVLLYDQFGLVYNTRDLPATYCFEFTL